MGSVYIRDMVYRGGGRVFDFDRVVGKWNQNAGRVGLSSTDVTDHLPEQPLSSTSSLRRSSEPLIYFTQVSIGFRSLDKLIWIRETYSILRQGLGKVILCTLVDV